MNKKIVFGYFLVILGLVIPLIGFFGMSYNNFSARSDYEDFKDNYASSIDEKASIEEDIAGYNENISRQTETTLVDPFSTDDYRGTYDFEALEADGVFAYLLVPKLDMVKPIYLDATNDHLAKGVAQIDGTSLPVGGLGTRSVIAGHRGWYNDTMFLNIEDLEVGDRVFVDRGADFLEYEVTDMEVIGPSDWDKLGPKEDQDMLTLLTCHPFAPPRPYRLLVNCVRVEDEVVETGKARSSVKTDDVLSRVSSTSTASKTKMINMGIYGITGVLIIALVVVVWKFVRELRVKR